jgi:hypothetical protein
MKLRGRPCRGQPNPVRQSALATKADDLRPLHGEAVLRALQGDPLRPDRERCEHVRDHGTALAISGLLLIIATHYGHFG